MEISSQTQTMIVQDTAAPVPDAAVLLVITGECSAAVSIPPTATDNCAGRMLGQQAILCFTPSKALTLLHGIIMMGTAMKSRNRKRS